MFFSKKKKVVLQPSPTSSGSMIDEWKKNYSKKTMFLLPYSVEDVFKAIIKTSFLTFKGTNWKNFPSFKVGDSFKPKNGTNKYELSEFAMNEIYELTTTIEGVKYWMRYTLVALKPAKTKINYEQSLYFTSSIYGFRGNIAKMNFSKEFERNTKKIIEQINIVAKGMTNEISN